MPLLKYRLHGLRPPPRIIKLAIPGWAGEQQPRADGSHEQPWHCLPYTESARYGVELIYPFDQEMRVTNFRGRVRLEADWGEPPDDMMWPPFRAFGADYYSYQISLDLEAEKVDFAQFAPLLPKGTELGGFLDEAVKVSQ